MHNDELAQLMVQVILDDLTDRKGLRQQWEMIDPDIQSEIFEGWKESTLDLLNKHRPEKTGN